MFGTLYMASNAVVISALKSSLSPITISLSIQAY